jgi:hypothetical protein
MSREFKITAPKTYASIENARKAVAKTGDEGIRHTMIQQDGRWFPVFFPTEAQLSETGIHFRWNCVR